MKPPMVKGVKVRIEDAEGFGVVSRAMMRFRYSDEGGKVCKLPPAARDVYAVLWSAMVVEGACPSVADVMDLSGSSSKNTVLDSIQLLERTGWIVVEPAGVGKKQGYLLRQNVAPAIQTQLDVLSKSDALVTKPELKQHPLTKTFTEWWMFNYLADFGKPYKYAGRKDWQAVQELIKYFETVAGGNGLDVLQNTVRDAWRNPTYKTDKFVGSAIKTLSGFNYVLNRLTISGVEPSGEKWKGTRWERKAAGQ